MLSDLLMKSVLVSRKLLQSLPAVSPLLCLMKGKVSRVSMLEVTEWILFGIERFDSEK